MDSCAEKVVGEVVDYVEKNNGRICLKNQKTFYIAAVNELVHFVN
jgi:hypothetical protein